jgi:cephalosporin hydroxylase
MLVTMTEGDVRLTQNLTADELRREESVLPPAVSIDLGQRMLTYWLDRARQHTLDSYAGVPISKFPEDLRVYEHLLWISRADTVIEIGAHLGGSALWFRDRLRTFAQYGRCSSAHVISIDLDIAAAESNIKAVDPGYARTITLLRGDIRDPATPYLAIELVRRGSRCLVVEDSAHIYDTTRAALTGFAPLVPLGGYFVVEDGCVDVDEMRISEDWPRGVLPAIRDWLGTPQGAGFSVRRDLERYGVSCHHGGFLQRTAAESP